VASLAASSSEAAVPVMSVSAEFAERMERMLAKLAKLVNGFPDNLLDRLL
jgi:hypothetical protein